MPADLESAVDSYLREASDDIALGFVDAVERAATNPQLGSDLFRQFSGLRVSDNVPTTELFEFDGEPQPIGPRAIRTVLRACRPRELRCPL